MLPIRSFSPYSLTTLQSPGPSPLFLSAPPPITSFLGPPSTILSMHLISHQASPLTSLHMPFSPCHNSIFGLPLTSLQPPLHFSPPPFTSLQSPFTSLQSPLHFFSPVPPSLLSYFFSFLLTFQTRPSSLVPKPPSPTTSLQVLQALPHNPPPPFSLSLPLATLHSHPSLLLPQPPPHLLTRYPFMSLMIPFFLSSPILPHIFLSPTPTFLHAPLHFPHDPLTALSLFPLHFSPVTYLHTSP